MIRNLIRPFRFLAGFCVGAILLPFLYLFLPWRRVRFGELLEDRIGHLAANSELYMRRRNNRSRRCIDIFFAYNPANRFLMDLLKSEMLIIENLWIRRLYPGANWLLSKTPFSCELPSVPVVEPLEFLECPPSLKFSDKHHRLAREKMEIMELTPDDWYVCFHARDAGYLASRENFGVSSANERTYFDCSIDNYVEAMEWVVSKGGVAIRMGHLAAKALHHPDPKIVDYATLYRDDFMDIYLPAHARFFVGCASGLLCVPRIFNIPTVSTNHCPYPWVGTRLKRNIDIPKLLKRKSDGKVLTFPEVKRLGLLECYRDDHQKLRYLFDESTYEKLDLEWVENTPAEITEVCMDMVDMIEGKPLDPHGLHLREMYSNLYENMPLSPQRGGISPRFALRHHALIKDSPCLHSA